MKAKTIMMIGKESPLWAGGGGGGVAAVLCCWGWSMAVCLSLSLSIYIYMIVLYDWYGQLQFDKRMKWCIILNISNFFFKKIIDMYKLIIPITFYTQSLKSMRLMVVNVWLISSSYKQRISEESLFPFSIHLTMNLKLFVPFTFLMR